MMNSGRTLAIRSAPIPALAVEGRLAELTPADEVRLFDRGRAGDPGVERVVASIIAEVSAGGDRALYDLARRYDRVELPALEVPAEVIAGAVEAIEPELREALEEAMRAIEAFHRAQLPSPLEVEIRSGVRLGRRAQPLRRVGVYAPGGRAAYPSSVLMGVVPARVAGVEEVIVASPAGPDGLPPLEVLAAASIGGADRLFALGGASAIAALALGTESVPQVEKIVGPGNAFVTEAKRQLTGRVAIDSPAGPSEILVIADDEADPGLVAVEMIAQAEHDPDAAAVLVTTSARLATEVRDTIAEVLSDQPRREIIEAALAARGGILIADSLDEALEFSNHYAPEHLAIMTGEPRALLEGVRVAGTVFLGAPSSVAFGDYMSGANHVLPTSGLARAYSGLNALDFLRFTTYQELSREGAARLSRVTALLAEAEGLPAHALAARLRAAERVAAKVEGGDPPGGVSATPRRATYRKVPLYDPGRRPIEIDLSDNTSLFGPPPSALVALTELGEDALTRYPEVYADSLKAAIAELHGVRPENVVTGCGLDDVIDSAFRAFGEPNDTVVYPEPTFGMIPLFARMNALRPVGVRLIPESTRGFRIDVDQVLGTRAKITYLCQPNNPTGTLFDRETIEEIGVGAVGVVLLDEAYADFAGNSMIRWAAESTRTIALRTLSKAWGLAGLRIGYGIGPVELVREIERSRGPYKITAAADAAARAALRDDRTIVEGNIALTRLNRERLRAELEGLGIYVWPSEANFLLLSVPEGFVAADRDGGDRSSSARVSPALRLAEGLREYGIGVRAFPGLEGIGDAIRVSIGPWDLLERFSSAIRALLHSEEGGDR